MTEDLRDGVYVGVDGGGTGTTALVVDAEGRELGSGAAGPALIDPLAPSSAAGAVMEAVEQALEDADPTAPVLAIWAGLAGAGREASRTAVERLLSEADLAATVAVGTDLEAATSDAFPAGPGILVIAGTGSVAWARGPSGTERRIGGWGAHLGDEGSGYAIGLAALRRVLRASDGRGAATGLTDAILSVLELTEAPQLVEWGHQATKSGIAALTSQVVEVAGRGDEVAAEVLAEAVRDLAGHVVGLRDALGPWGTPPGCAMAGGLLGPTGPLRPPLSTILKEGGLEPLEAEIRPERGAARAAVELTSPHRS